MKWKAHAKLNLALDITGQRPDGYHTIDTIFQEITLCDELDIRPSDRLEIDCPGVPADTNLALHAARAFFALSRVDSGAVIRIDKRIPMGAGLGGGSSDAAAVLCALNHMYGHPLSRSDLLNAAVQLGADTPACINGGTQRARGIGDRLSRMRSRCSFQYLLVMPESGISTKEAYALYDRMPKTHVDVQRVARALQCADRTAVREAMGNALQPAACALVPEIPQIGQECMGLGAAHWQVTGSGSCVFAIFRDADRRVRAAERLAQRYPFVALAENCHRDADYASP